MPTHVLIVCGNDCPALTEGVGTVKTPYTEVSVPASATVSVVPHQFSVLVVARFWFLWWLA